MNNKLGMGMLRSPFTKYKLDENDSNSPGCGRRGNNSIGRIPLVTQWKNNINFWLEDVGDERNLGISVVSSYFVALLIKMMNTEGA